jgi:CheY-like chemotaxis protein
MDRQLIMVIDDDEGVRSGLSDLLESDGYRVVAVPDGKEALVRLSAGELPHLILLDLMMPVTDGWKFRAEQMVNPALASIPVIVITAVSPSERRADLGVALVTKPFDTRTLLAAVRKHTAPHRRGVDEQSARAL